MFVRPFTIHHPGGGAAPGCDVALGGGVVPGGNVAAGQLFGGLKQHSMVMDTVGAVVAIDRSLVVEVDRHSSNHGGSCGLESRC